MELLPQQGEWLILHEGVGEKRLNANRMLVKLSQSVCKVFLTDRKGGIQEWQNVESDVVRDGGGLIAVSVTRLFERILPVGGEPAGIMVLPVVDGVTMGFVAVDVGGIPVC